MDPLIITWTLLSSHRLSHHHTDSLIIAWTLLSSHRPSHYHMDPLVVVWTLCCHYTDTLLSLHAWCSAPHGYCIYGVGPSIVITWTLYCCYMDPLLSLHIQCSAPYGYCTHIVASCHHYAHSVAPLVILLHAWCGAPCLPLVCIVWHP
jgi:hypothetical protein